MEFKNKKIDLFGTEYSIKFIEEVKDSEGNNIYGMADPSNKVIYVAKTINGTPIKSSEIKLSLLHELVHAIFMTGQYMSENEDEPLVEWTARCIYQLLKKNII